VGRQSESPKGEYSAGEGGGVSVHVCSRAGGQVGSRAGGQEGKE
jgi:hypothetical protein